MKRMFLKMKESLQKLSFRTGIIVLLSCIPFYILSFAQFGLPFGVEVKTALWVVFFGLAKATQYCGLTILGAKGIHKLKSYIKKTSLTYKS